MTEPDNAGEPEKKKPIPLPRIALWVLAGGFGLYMLISGIVGIAAQGG